MGKIIFVPILKFLRLSVPLDRQTDRQTEGLQRLMPPLWAEAYDDT